jgi:Rieske Fe-S protein
VVVPLDTLPEPGAGMPLELEGHAVVLARPDVGCAVVVARACTHQGCDVAFSGGRFVCPCHGAAFGLDGAVLSGPTSVPLRRYPAELRDEVLWVDLG